MIDKELTKNIDTITENIISTGKSADNPTAEDIEKFIYNEAAYAEQINEKGLGRPL